uniref:AlgX/AlgJ SGNH hydrolase-like domain-containing protein n=1 Tax=Desulfovibrio sp. U5L TaxID=596152 RepID=I2Q0K1_9BACT
MQSNLTFARRTVYFLSSLLFVTLLVLPTADRFVRFAPQTLMMERDAGKLVALTGDPATWIKWFDTLRRGYLERHYNLRSLLITWNSFLDTFVLASTSSSSQVMAGKGHWLFLAQDGPRNILEDARSSDPLPEESVDVLVRELERRREWLEKRGIRYLVMVAPNKNTVYPENLPEYLRPRKPEGHLQQLVNYARAYTKLDIVDVTPGILEQKKTNQVFYITDSHWNAHGAFAAYRQVIEALKKDFPAIVPLERSQFSVEQYNWLPGDLANMMGLAEHLKEDRIMYFNKDWYKARGLSYDGPTDPHYFEYPQYSVTGNTKLPNAIVFHDSFWWELLPFLAESFDKGLYVWLLPQTNTEFRFFDTALIEREKPDVVIDEFTERYILPPLRGGFHLKTDGAVTAPSAAFAKKQ